MRSLLMAMAAVVSGLGVTSSRDIQHVPTHEAEEDFFVKVTNKNQYRVEIGISYSPSTSRRIGRVPPNSERTLKATLRDTPFVLVITLKGAGVSSARGGAQDTDLVLYTDVMTASAEQEIPLEIPANIALANFRTRRP